VQAKQSGETALVQLQLHQTLTPPPPLYLHHNHQLLLSHQTLMNLLFLHHASDITLCAIASDFRTRCNKSQSNGIPAVQGFGFWLNVVKCNKKGWQSKEHNEVGQSNIQWLAFRYNNDARCPDKHIWGLVTVFASSTCLEWFESELLLLVRGEMPK